MGISAYYGYATSKGENMATHIHTATSIGRVLIGLAVLWGIIGLSGTGSWAADDEHARATLRGLQGVEEGHGCPRSRWAHTSLI